MPTIPGPIVFGEIQRGDSQDTYPIVDANNLDGGLKSATNSTGLTGLLNVKPMDLAIDQSTGVIYQYVSGVYVPLPASSLPNALGTVTSVALSAPAEFSVGGSPVTGAGTLTLSKVAQAANALYAGPGSGASAAPTFRSLVPADVPAINLAASGNGGVTGLLPVANGGTGTASPSLVAGTNITITGSWPSQTINASASGGGGTVTSVDVSGGTTGLTTSGGPVTTSGTITLAGTLAVANGGTGNTTAAVPAANLTGNTLASGVTASSLTSAAGGNGLADAAATSAALPLASTFHVVWTTNGAAGGNLVYINGVSVSLSTNAALSYITSGTVHTTIGEYYNGSFVNSCSAKVGHVAVYNKILSGAQVLAHYNAGK